MAWIKVTGPAGNVLMVNVDQIVRVRPPDGAEAPGTQAVVDFANTQSQATRETVDQIMLLIEPPAASPRRSSTSASR
jgi:hypothetical protein